jgi:hypothetical protein
MGLDGMLMVWRITEKDCHGSRHWITGRTMTGDMNGMMAVFGHSSYCVAVSRYH